MDELLPDRWERLAHDYSPAWIAAVRAQGPLIAEVAYAAAQQHSAGVAEDVAITHLIAAHTGVVRRDRPHADAPNGGLQAIRALRDEGLWPWRLVH